MHADTTGAILSADAWRARKESMLPSTGDNLFITSLMHAAREPGTFAGWIAPPRQGIDNKPGDFEYRADRPVIHGRRAGSNRHGPACPGHDGGGRLDGLPLIPRARRVTMTSGARGNDPCRVWQARSH